MNCSAVVKILNEFIDGALDQPRHEAVMRHLAECDGCAREQSILRSLICESGQLADYEMPESLHQSVMAAVAAEKCAHASERMSAAADYELEPTENEMVITHASQCPECSSQLSFLRASSAAVSSLGLLTPPDGLREKILAATVGSKSTQRESAMGWLSGLLNSAGKRAVTATAGAGFVLLVAVSLMSKGPAPTPIAEFAQREEPMVVELPARPETDRVLAKPDLNVASSPTSRAVSRTRPSGRRTNLASATHVAMPVPAGNGVTSKSTATKPANTGAKVVARNGKPVSVPEVAPPSIVDEPAFIEPSAPNHSEIAATPAQPATMARSETPVAAPVEEVAKKTAFAKSASLVMENSNTEKWLKNVKESRPSAKNGIDIMSVKF